MKVSEVLNLSFSDKEAWLETIKADQDEELLCYVVTFDYSVLEDWLAYPEDYEIGGSLKEVWPELADSRASEITAGAKLSDEELARLKEAVWQDQVNNDEGHDGRNYMGFEAPCIDGSVYALFYGYSEGQGGVPWTLEGVYESKAKATAEMQASVGEDERPYPI